MKVEIVSVNISRKKGVIKTPVTEAVVNSEGIVGDAHLGEWHRQISMLGEESILRFENQLGRKITFGEFAENITTRGLELKNCEIGDRFVGEEIILEVTQIGKKCHGHGCAIFQQVGNCVMPVEGIFCKVIRGGIIRPNQILEYRKK